jgi:hypothetical protein
MRLAGSKGLCSATIGNSGWVIRDDIEHRYTLNKGRLPGEVVEDLFGAYRRNQEYLETGRSESARAQAFNRSSILVSQGGYHLDCRNAEVSGDPLMNVGEEYVFFLIRWSNSDGTVRPEFLASMGGLSMFLVRDGRVYPRFESWTPSVSGRLLEDILGELNSYLT